MSEHTVTGAIRRAFSFAISLTVLIGIASTTSLIPSEAQAQPKGSAGALLEEILVVSRKKSAAEQVQDVPLAITAFSGNQLDALFVKKLDDLSFSMPNVSLEQVGTFPGVQNFAIRGQGINSSIPSVDPTVGTFIDGMYLGVTFGVVIDTFDLESVEVLRGPQGLLFGRNVTGGAVVMRTARPDGEFGFKARAGVTDQSQYNLTGSVEGSLVEDKVFVKLSVYHDNDDGYFGNEGSSITPGAVYFNPSTGRDVGAMETNIIRPTLVFKPTDTLEMTLIGESGKSEGDGAPWANALAQMGSGPLAPTVQGRKFNTTIDETGETDMDWKHLIFEIKWDVGEGVLTNIAGWREVDAFSVPDIDGTTTPIFTAPGRTSQEQFSNELRWAGSLMDGKWDTTVGVYYFEQDVDYRESRFVAGGALRLALGGQMDHKTWGVFTHNDYHITDTLTATFGLRYTEEDKDAQVIDAGCRDVINHNCRALPLSDSWSNVTPKIGLNWHFADNAQAYVFWTKGFRSGGVNFRNALPSVIPAGPTMEEEQNSFEAGIKSDLMDGRLRVNLAGFYNKIDNIQRELNIGAAAFARAQPSLASVVVLQGTVNAGDVTIKGVEADIVALLSDNFSINGSVGYQEGEYDRIDPVIDSIAAGLQTTRGRILGPDLPRLSPWTASLGATWDIPLGDAGLLTVRGGYNYRDRTAYDDANTNFFPELRMINASVHWTSPDDRWKVSIYGKNLKDEANWGNLTTIAPGAIVAGPMQKGRLYGAEVSFTY